MKVVCHIAVLALAISLSHAGIVRWVGGDMGFSNADNWANGLAPIGNASFCNTTFGVTGKTIIASLGAATYNVGKTLYLPRNGVLRVESFGSVIAFNAPVNGPTCNQDAPSPVWTGGAVAERRNDLACHRNWEDVDDPTKHYVPCAGDIAQFDSGNSYEVFVPNNVTLMVMAQLSFGVVSINAPTSNLSYLLPQINLVSTTATVLIGSTSSSGVSIFNAVCRPLYQFAPGTTQCACYSSCPTPTQIAQQEANTQANMQAAVAAQLVLQNTYITRNFVGTFSAAALLATPDQLQTNFENTTQVQALQTAVRMAISSGLPASSLTITQFVLSGDNSSIIIHGVVNATNRSLFAGGSTATPPNPITWTATSPVPPADATRLQTIIQGTVSPALLTYYAQELQALIDNARATLPTTTVNLANTINSINPPSAGTTATNAGASTPCLSTCGSDCSACLADIIAAINATGVVNETLATQLAQAIVNACQGSSASCANTVDAAASLSNATHESTTVAAQTQAATPQTYTVSSSPFVLGQTSSVADQLRAVSPINKDRMLSSLRAAVLRIASITGVSNMHMSWVRNVNSGSRRRSTPRTASGVVVTLSYNITCLPNDATCQSNATTTPTYSAINSGLGAAFSSFVPTLNQCQLTGTAAVAANAIYNTTCINELATGYCMGLYYQGVSETVARFNTSTMLYALTRCGTQPPEPSGSCFDTSYSATAQSLASTTSLSITCSESAAASSSSGGGSIGMAAGAAGAGILIVLVIVIVVVMMRRKKSRRGSEAKKTGGEDRNVVAFANPMYDDQTALGPSQPVYDSTSPGMGGHHEEGLYDEPAFTPAQKSNPVYASTDDITQDMGGERGPASSGYLDVMPTGPEDAGYLGAQEEPDIVEAE